MREVLERIYQRVQERMNLSVSADVPTVEEM